MWDEARDKVLIDGVAKGESFSEIAKRIPDKSRNACIGRAKRLGLCEDMGSIAVRRERVRQLERQQEEARIKRNAEARMARAAQAEEREKARLEAEKKKAEAAKKRAALVAARPAYKPKRTETPADARPAAITALEKDGCRFPISEPTRGQHVFCGAPRREGSSYCPGHHVAAHQRQTAPDVDEEA